MNRWFQEAQAWLEPRQKEMVDLLRDAVNIETGSHDKEGVDRFGALMASQMQSMGFQLDHEPQEGCGDHLRGVLESPGRSSVLLVGHLDTVWPKGTLAEWPFSIENGRAHGPGVGDMKGGLVVGLYAVRALQAVGAPLPRRLSYVLIGDEELGSPTGRPLMEEEGRRSDAALVVEPGWPNGEIVTARGGVGICELRATGRTAHAAMWGEKRASAIEALAGKVPQLHALTRLEERMSVNVGMIQGGSARQVIADRAWALVDLRAPTPEKVREIESAVRQIVSTSPPDTRIEAEVRWTRPPAPKTPKSPALLSVAREVALDLGITNLVDITCGGGSDGSFVAALGVPILDAMGPLSGGVCSRFEYVELSTMVPRAALLAGIIGGLAEGGLPE